MLVLEHVTDPRTDACKIVGDGCRNILCCLMLPPTGRKIKPNQSTTLWLAVARSTVSLTVGVHRFAVTEDRTTQL